MFVCICISFVACSIFSSSFDVEMPWIHWLLWQWVTLIASFVWMHFHRGSVCLAFADGRCGRTTSQEEVVYTHRTASVYAKIYTSLTMFRAEREMFCWYNKRTPNSSVDFWEIIKLSGVFFIGRAEKCLPVIWPIINYDLVICQGYCSYLQPKYVSKYSYANLRGRDDYM